jgi:hypothetical protein
VLQCPDFTLRRTFVRHPSSLLVHYELSADPGYRFIWAGHVLLDLSQEAVFTAPAGTPARLFPEAAGLIECSWPEAAPHVTGAWPAPHGLRLDRLGPADGTAVGAVLTGCAAATVTDGPDALAFRLEADADVPVSTALWRNLGGFPAGAPYRSIGVEPMLGATWDLAEAGPDEAATVPAGGSLRWELEITATRIVDH